MFERCHLASGVLEFCFFSGEVMASWTIEHGMFVYGCYVKDKESLTAVQRVSVPFQRSSKSYWSHP